MNKDNYPVTRANLINQFIIVPNGAEEGWSLETPEALSIIKDTMVKSGFTCIVRRSLYEGSHKNIYYHCMFRYEFDTYKGDSYVSEAEAVLDAAYLGLVAKQTVLLRAAKQAVLLRKLRRPQ